MEVKTNSKGTNAKIQTHILPYEEMRAAGFYGKYYEDTDHEKDCPYFYFMRSIQFPKDKKWRGMDLTFKVHIPKDGSDIEIGVIDENFGQYYNYFYMKNECSRIVDKEVEKWMEYLQDKGILSGHVKGEYV